MISLESQYPPIEVSTPATDHPVTVDEAKQYCDYEDSDRNDQFYDWIRTATAIVEHDCEVALCSQTCKLYLPWFLNIMELRKPPVSSVTSVTYLDSAGASQTLATTVYDVNLKRWPPRIRLAEDQSWPTTQLDTENAVTIEFVAGFGLDSTDPKWPMYQQAVLRKIKWLFDGCGESADMVYEAILNAIRWKPVL